MAHNVSPPLSKAGVKFIDRASCSLDLWLCIGYIGQRRGLYGSREQQPMLNSFTIIIRLYLSSIALIFKIACHMSAVLGSKQKNPKA